MSKLFGLKFLNFFTMFGWCIDSYPRIIYTEILQRYCEEKQFPFGVVEEELLVLYVIFFKNSFYFFKLS